jgi:translocation protein SEC72
MVINLRRNWPKGHFRKAKTLVAMGRLEEASEAIGLGLAFEPTNTVRRISRGCLCAYFYFLICQELLGFLAEIKAKQAESKLEKQPLVAIEAN